MYNGAFNIGEILIVFESLRISETNRNADILVKLTRWRRPAFSQRLAILGRS
jgi:hypothetical protein